MSLKELLQRDLTTFINEDEFAETINYNGVEILAVVTQTASASQSKYTVKRQIDPARHLKLAGNFFTVYVKTADLPKLPKYGEFVKINGVRYKIQTVIVDLEGITRITVGTDLDGAPVGRV